MSSPTNFPQIKTMVDFKPFRAWHYNPDKIKFQNVIAPPYDIISGEKQKDLYARSPYNCIRLILNREEGGDSESQNRYTRARDFFEVWRRENILIQDQNPHFYLYGQTFEDPRDGSFRKRFALLGCLRLEAFEKGVVIPHEKTLAKPREDRRKLLDATHANFSPVFGLYEDAENKLAACFSRVTQSSPYLDVTDEEKVQHALWMIDDPKTIREIQNRLSQNKIFIADGHHRYQTALDYARDKHLQEGISSETFMPYDFRLTALVEFNDPGLVLLPTHRILSAWPGFDLSRALDTLAEFFKIEECPAEMLDEKIKYPAGEGEISFGLITEKGSYFLSLSEPENAIKAMGLHKPAVWYKVDVNLLSELVLKFCWKFPPERLETLVQYTRSPGEARASVQQGKSIAAFLLKPPRVDALREMGKVHELMPQKSTYFFPKLASGLVFYHHDS
ncbi:MAG TPA: DUF1015 domain-containing protein [bacterium]|nr:DUF1015 domain-containing protein [bacterium]